MARGSWVDWVFQLRWAEGPTGSITAWRRDAGEVAFTRVLRKTGVATLQRTATSRGRPQHYWKTGFYRPSPRSITNQLWIEGPARGATFDAVAVALWGR